MKQKNCDILILGAGPAGLTAALYASRAGHKTVIVERLVAGGAIATTPLVTNYPAIAQITGAELGVKMKEQSINAGAEFISDEVLFIDAKNKTVTCEDGVFGYKALIIAMGTKPRRLFVSNEEKFLEEGGVHDCVYCDGNLYKGKDIVIVGGGNSAVQGAIYMDNIAKSITILNNTPDFNAEKANVAKIKKIPVHHNIKVTQIIGANKVEGIEFQNTQTGRKQTVKCDGIFVSIGRDPETKLFNEMLKLTKDGYIYVDDKMQTSVAGVFAVGDIIDKRVRQIVTAVSDGAIAAVSSGEFLKN